jgi:hypothetical protein
MNGHCGRQYMLFKNASYGASLTIGIMECWNPGMMGLKKPVFQPSTTPSFHAAYLENGRQKYRDSKKIAEIPIHSIICLPQALNQAVKIVIAVKFDFNFTFFPVFFNHDLGAEVTGEIFGEAGKMYLLGAIFGNPGLSLLRFQASYEGFSFPDRQLFGDNRPPGRKPLGRCLGTQQRSGMSHAQRAVGNVGFDLIRQLAQPQKVCYRRSAFAHPGGCLVLG